MRKRTNLQDIKQTGQWPRDLIMDISHTWKLAPFVALLIFASNTAHAYEITTHALITDRAYQQSTLNPHTEGSVAPLLGLDRKDDDKPFAFIDELSNWTNVFTYYDDGAVLDPINNPPPLDPAHSRKRWVQEQERRPLDHLVAGGYVPGSSGRTIEQQVRAWLMRGVIREDDNDFHITGTWHTYDKRDPDPYGDIFRSAGHFYDPLHDRAMDHTSLCATYTCVKSPSWALGRRNTLEPGPDVDDTYRRNHFTWQDGRNNYWWALTLKRQETGDKNIDAIMSSQERQQRLATTIKSIGHVIHLLQDTSQPQHVRNDIHGPPVISWMDPSEGLADAAFEAYTEYRVIRNHKEAVGFELKGGNPLRHMVEGTPPAPNYLPHIMLGESNPYPGNGGQVMFSTPLKFFTTRHVEAGEDVASLRSRRGLADFSNRSFFTAGTLPGFRECPQPDGAGCDSATGPTYPLPPNDLADPGYTEELLQPSGLRVNNRTVFLSELTYPITDSIAPNYDDSTHALDDYDGRAPLLTKGVWSDLIPNDVIPPERSDAIAYVITYNNMRYMADVELPRAVGYSAGMIDYFFRGRLDLTSPPGGLFGIVDHATPHGVDSDGYTFRFDDHDREFGFETVRARVKNATADIIESGTNEVFPQDAGSGRLVAIARYHRNPCYQIDLSGEYVRKPDGTITVPSGCALEKTRTGYQEISVSAPLAIDSDGNFSGTNDGSNACANMGNLNAGATGACAHGAGVLAEFDFSDDPIPINATDLFLQVAYRGGLGEEADGIALGRMDILEPNYHSVWNNSDWFLYQGQWHEPGEVADLVPSDVDTDPVPIEAIVWCWEDQMVFGFDHYDPIGPGEFIRVATIADQLMHRVGPIANFADMPFWYQYPLAGTARQSEKEIGGPYTPEPFLYARGTTIGENDWNYYFKRWPTTFAPPKDDNGVPLAWFLEPALRSNRGAGLPVPGMVMFTSQPEAPCSQLPLAESAEGGGAGTAGMAGASALQRGGE